MGGQAMEENMIHRYISESPFFDYTTKNGLIMDQSRTNGPAFELTKNRRAFEDQLSRQKGSEYMIVGDSQEGNGVWNIRKQDRDRRRMADGRFEEELTTLGSYYIVGENMYQAPSVGDVVGNRLVSAAASLSKFLDAADDLPSFSPTTGYSYLPGAAKPTASGSTQASPARSREGSVVPGAETQSLRSGSLAPDSQAGTTSHGSNSQDARILAQSFRMALEFGDEYMDENPLVGEPGHFSFTSSTAAVKKRKQDDEAAVAAAKAKEEQKASSRATSPKVEKPPSPPAVMTEAKTAAKAEKDRRGSKLGEKIKRKKSRPNAASPTTPRPSTAGLPPNAAG